MKRFRFYHAIILSLILHSILSIILSLSSQKDDDKTQESKYLKVKVGTLNANKAITKHQKKAKQANLAKKIKQSKQQNAKKQKITKPKKLLEIPKIALKNKPSYQSSIKPKKIHNKPKPVNKLPIQINKKQNTEQQDVQNNGQAKGQILGNRSFAIQKTIDNYRQLIVLWLEKHQVYPEEAKKNKLTGRATIRLSLQKDGKLLDYRLQQATGHGILDRAILLMVKNSDPFPKFPDNYPDVEFDEFEIKADIVLKRKVSADRLENLF